MSKISVFLWLCCLCFVARTQNTENKEKIILIACGSFNPPTLMHFRMFEIARDHFRETEQAHVIAGIISPDHELYKKETTTLVANHYRRDMVNLTVASSDWIRLSEWEIDQETWTATDLVLQYHQNYVDSILRGENVTIPNWLPSNIADFHGQHIQVKLLCGADLLDSMIHWGDGSVENIMENNGVVAVARNKIDLRNTVFNSDFMYGFKKNITIVDDWLEHGISSTVIRRFLRRGNSVKYLVHDDVIQYIHDNDLYDSNVQTNNVS